MSSAERRELLKQTFKTSCSLMLQSKELPYNPYPTLVRDLRQVQTELEFSHIDISEKKSYFNQQVQTLGDTGKLSILFIMIFHRTKNLSQYNEIYVLITIMMRCTISAVFPL